jgi:hypothetical protein
VANRVGVVIGEGDDRLLLGSRLFEQGPDHVCDSKLALRNCHRKMSFVLLIVGEHTS